MKQHSPINTVPCASCSMQHWMLELRYCLTPYAEAPHESLHPIFIAQWPSQEIQTLFIIHSATPSLSR